MKSYVQGKFIRSRPHRDMGSCFLESVEFEVDVWSVISSPLFRALHLGYKSRLLICVKNNKSSRQAWNVLFLLLLFCKSKGSDGLWHRKPSFSVSEKVEVIQRKRLFCHFILKHTIGRKCCFPLTVSSFICICYSSLMSGCTDFYFLRI